MTRTVVYDLGIDWDFDGSFTDETARLVRASGRLQLAPPASSITSPRGTVDQCTLELDNKDGRFSPLNTGGALYSDIQSGGMYHAPCYLRISIDGGSNYYRVFTGVMKIPQEQGPTPNETATVTIDCRSRDEELLTKRVSTSNTHFVTANQNGWTESDYIDQWLTDAGYADGADYSLDDGLFVVPYGWLDDESPLEEIWQLAAACGGRFYADPDGLFRYEAATHWLTSPHTSSQETLTESDYERIVPYYADTELYKSVTVEVSPREPSLSGVLWQADEVVVIPSEATKTITARLRQPSFSIDSTEFTAVTGGGKNMDSDIDVALTKYAQRCDIAITNNNTAFSALLVTLQLTGVPIDGRPSSEESAESSDSFWTDRQGRTRALRGNPFVQTPIQAAMLAEFLRDRYETPRLFFKLVGVPGDAERRLGDLITINDAVVMSSSLTAYIIGIDWTASDRGFAQTLTCMDATGLYKDDSYFIIGSSDLGGSDVLFY